MGHCSSSPSPSTKGHGGEICRIPFPHCFIRFYGSILLLDHVRLLPDYLFHGYSLHFVCVRPFSSLTSNTSPTRFLLQVQHTRAQSAVVLFQPFFFSVLEVVLCKFKGRVENKPGTYKNRNKHENYLRWLFKEMEINSLLWGPKKKKNWFSPQVGIKYIPQQHGSILVVSGVTSQKAMNIKKPKKPQVYKVWGKGGKCLDSAWGKVYCQAGSFYLLSPLQINSAEQSLTSGRAGHKGEAHICSGIVHIPWLISPETLCYLWDFTVLRTIWGLLVTDFSSIWRKARELLRRSKNIITWSAVYLIGLRACGVCLHLKEIDTSHFTYILLNDLKNISTYGGICLYVTPQSYGVIYLLTLMTVTTVTWYIVQVPQPISKFIP